MAEIIFMNIDTTIIAAIFGLIGIILGSLLSGAGYLYKSKIEKIRTIHRNIFYLLKVYHLAQAIQNVEKGNSLYLKKLENYFSQVDISVDNDILIKLSNYISFMIINPIWEQLESDFSTKFNESVIDLSNIKPVTAYNLSKQSYFYHLIKQVNELMAAAPMNHETTNYIQQNDISFEKGFFIGIKMSHKHILNEFSILLEKSIRCISWNASFLNFFLCRFELLKIKRKFESEKFEKFIDEYVKNNATNLLNSFKK